MKLFYELKHEDIAVFAKEYLKKKNIGARSYNLGTALSFVLVASITGYGYAIEILQGLDFLQQMGFAIAALFVVLLPIHELIHGVVYKYLGAPRVRFKIHWKSFAIMTEAPDFLITSSQFKKVALAPFAFISISLLVTIMLTPLTFRLFFSWCLLFHTLCCGGDFALVSFCLAHKDRSLWTKDLAGQSLTYFYAK